MASASCVSEYTQRLKLFFSEKMQGEYRVGTNHVVPDVLAATANDDAACELATSWKRARVDRDRR